MSNIPKTMNAFVLQGHGDLTNLHWHTDWPVPDAGETDVFVRVEACGLNNTDVNTRSGWYSKSVEEATTGDGYKAVGGSDPSWGGAPIGFPRIQGADAVGTVISVGATVDATLIGKRVLVDCWLRDWADPMNLDKTGYFGSERDGGFAQYTSVDYRNVGVVESDLTSAELATFSCSYTTAEGMLSRARVTEADSVLVTGASGGVGSALVQLAKRRGASVVALASQSKWEAVRELGADVTFSRNQENLSDALKKATGSPNVSVIADIVGGGYFGDLINVLHRGGRYTCSGAIAGPMVGLDLRTLYLRDLTFTGSTVLPPHIFKDLIGYIENGEVRSVLAAKYPLADLKKAQQAFIGKKHTGNIVVVP